MKVHRPKPTFQDYRGTIIDLLSKESFDAATIIEIAPGAIRGNHYHKDTTQYIYMISGEILYRTRQVNGAIIDSHLKSGDMILTEPNEAHAMQAISQSTFLVLTRGPRGGADYESDTFRLETPLI